jgi:hypothetical protein
LSHDKPPEKKNNAIQQSHRHQQKELAATKQLAAHNLQRNSAEAETHTQIAAYAQRNAQ